MLYVHTYGYTLMVQVPSYDGVQPWWVLNLGPDASVVGYVDPLDNGL